MEPSEVINEITTAIIDLPKNPFCKIPKTEKDHKTLIGLSCEYAEKMEDITYEAFQPIVQEYDFNELYSVIDNFIGYQHWVFSQFSEDQLGDIIKDLYGNQNIREAELNQDTWELFVNNVERYGEVKFFKELEFNFFSLRAISCKSVETWVHGTLFCIIKGVSGHLATRRLCKELGEVPSYNKTVFNYGEYKPFEGYLEKFGLDGVRTPTVDGEVNKILEKDIEDVVKHSYNLEKELEESFEITGTQRHKEHDMVSTYAEKWLKRVKELDDIEALGMLYEGCLRAFTKKRAHDRSKNEFKKDRRQFGDNKPIQTDFQEDIDEDENKTIRVTYSGNFPESKQLQTGEESEEFDSSYKENKTKQFYLSKFSPDSDHYKVLDAILEADFTTSKRNRGKKRPVNKAEISRKTGVSLKRVRKIFTDLKNDPEILILKEIFPSNHTV